MYQFFTRPLRVDPMLLGLVVVALTLGGVTIGHSLTTEYVPMVTELR